MTEPRAWERPDGTDEDPRVDVLAEQLCSTPGGWRDASETGARIARDAARGLLARLDAAAPVAEDRGVTADALHVASPLRTGRRVGRTIYAQLGPEPSDVDPLVATADSPVLAERIVRAVNAAPPIAEQAVPRNVFEGRARDVARALGDAVEDDDVPRWYDVMGRVRELARPPAQPAVAPHAQSAAPTRDVPADCGEPDHQWVQCPNCPRSSGPCACSGVACCVRHRDAVEVYVRVDRLPVTRTEEFSDCVRIDFAKVGSGRDGGRERVVGVEVLGASGVEVDGEDVLSGGGADGGGEDEVPSQDEVDDLRWESMIDGKISELAEAAGIERDGLDWRDILGCVRVILDALCDKAGAKANDLVAPAVAVRVGAAGVPSPDVARLARAAGVSPDSEDVVGEIEAAIRAGREPEVVREGVTSPLRPDVLGKEAKWHEHTDHSGTAIAIWLSEDDGSVWVTEDGEIAALSRYSGRYVAEWHGEAITAAHRWREDEMPVARGEIVSGKRTENAPHGTTLVRVDENGRALTGSSVIETDGGFNGSPSGRYRVLDLPAVVRVGTGGGETGE